MNEIARGLMNVLVAAAVCMGGASGQTQGDELSALRQRLQRVLENQARLDSENAALRMRMDAMSEAQQRLQSENASLRASDFSDQLEDSVNALLARPAAVTVYSWADPLTLKGEFRYRTMWTHSDPVSGSNSDEFDGFYTDSLVRLGFQYQFGSNVRAYAELQSHWAFGDGAGSNGGYPIHVVPAPNTVELNYGESSTPLGLHQGWLSVDQLFGADHLSMKLGRQEVILGNRFQFGEADWFTGWSFDGARIEWDSEDFRLTGLAFKLGSNDFDVNQFHYLTSTHDDDELYSLYFTLKSIEDHELDLYWIYINGHGSVPNGSGATVGSLGNFVGSPGQSSVPGATGTAYYHTFGARMGGVFWDVAAGLDYNVEAAVQVGDLHDNTAGVDDANGFTVEAEVGLTFEGESMFRMYGRFLFAEGADGDDVGYTPLYPTRHSNYGFMARYGMSDAIPMFNVLSLQGGLHFSPHKDWRLGATVIWAEADEPLAGGDDDWGTEVDLWAEYVYSDHLTFMFAAFAVFADDQLEAYLTTDDDEAILGVLFQARLNF